MIPTRIVSVCGDPGGAEAIAPVLSKLERQPAIAIQTFAYNQACKILSDRKISFSEIPAEVIDSWFEESLTEPNTALLFAATSDNGIDHEKSFVRAAKRVGVPSLSYIDFWSNYIRRFCDDQGVPIALSDTVAVIDEDMKAALLASAIEFPHVIVTGNPRFDELLESKDDVREEELTDLRVSLGINKGGHLLLFVSQGLSQSEAGFRETYGFDERSVLRGIIEICDSLDTCEEISLVVRPHPKEDTAWLTEEFWSSQRSTRVRLSNEGNGRVMAMASDMVLGMNSVFLVDAGLLGCKVLSLQPGLKKVDSFPATRMGLTQTAYDWVTARSLIKAALETGWTLPSQKSPESGGIRFGASDRLFKVVMDLSGVDADLTGYTHFKQS